MKADIVLKGNAVFTGLKDVPEKMNVAITGKVITYVGRDAIPSDWITPDTKVYDLEDKLVMPGISDAHSHYFFSAAIYSNYCCKEIFDSKSEKECIQMLTDFYRERPYLDKIAGFGWFPINWIEGEVPHQMPSKESLDKAFPDIPVYLMAADGHTFWCNTKALEKCNIHKDMKYTFGELGLGPDGEPNGILKELELITPCFNEFANFSDEIAEKTQEDLLKRIAQAGVTSFSDFAASTTISQDTKNLDMMQKMAEKGKLTVRMNIYPSLGLTPDFTIQKNLRKKYNTSMIKVCGLKQFFDGVTPTYTAALLEPYEDNPSTRGQIHYPKEIYDQCIVAANEEGFGVRLHAIGDAAVRTGLDIFEHSKAVNPNYNDCRNAIEHIENVDVTDIARFTNLNVTASMQPLHLPLDADEKVIRIGEKRNRYEWVLRSFLDVKTNLALGTDCPIVDVNPYENIYAAVTRCDLGGKPSGTNPQEKITLAETLKAYTYGSAYSHGREEELGTLEIGKLADITIADRNLFGISPMELKDCHSVMTIVDGKIVYENL